MLDAGMVGWTAYDEDEAYRPGVELLTRGEVVLEILLDCGGRCFHCVESLLHEARRSF